ncbi:MAG: amidohydrolase family protein [Hyphomicrobiales bacterium]|nr:amidohydrolase family protein [Hyphomicrobiales bacterium]MCP5001904.1 amidohydrolase family protein [Hyphomicrobiales bacterium]
MSDLEIFKARKIVTMDPACPEATHVSVRDGRIVAVGLEQDTAQWGDAKINDDFADKTIVPGFVEGHSHMFAGGIWRFVYVGYQDRIDPQGRRWSGLKSIDAVIERMRAEQEGLANGVPLIAWGFDPIFLPAPRANRHDFDQVSSERPIAVLHSNFHLMTINTAALRLAEYTADTDIEGIVMGEDGEPNGELQEMAVMFPVMRRMNIDIRALSGDGDGIRDFGRVCNAVGVTTATDLVASLEDTNVALLTEVTNEKGFPIRLVSVLNALQQSASETVTRAKELAPRSTEKLRLGTVKIVTDGSIQGFTARLREPGYHNGAPNGIWNIAPDQLNVLVDALLQSGIHTHIHVNGDEAIQVAIDAVDASLKKHPADDHRTVLQHCQMADLVQFEKMRDLGLCANLFANHIFYFGDQHKAITLGPERASAMDGCRSALDHDIPLAIHSDAPITPVAPLVTAWAAAERRTASGETLGKAECISAYEALHAITLGPAFTLRMEDEIGSIEPGKRADFAILDESPLDVDPGRIRDIDVWGTVLGGVVHRA